MKLRHEKVSLPGAASHIPSLASFVDAWTRLERETRRQAGAPGVLECAAVTIVVGRPASCALSALVSLTVVRSRRPGPFRGAAKTVVYEKEDSTQTLATRGT
jgi:hypothetical protein